MQENDPEKCSLVPLKEYFNGAFPLAVETNASSELMNKLSIKHGFSAAKITKDHITVCFQWMKKNKMI